jgi:hypothetical protein
MNPDRELKSIAREVAAALLAELRSGNGKLPKIGIEEIRAKLLELASGLSFYDRERLEELTCREVVKLVG